VPRLEWVRKVLVLGSGAIKIGEAAEFDYSGSQCIKALREENIETVLINPNIATIQTDPYLAGKVYLLPVIPRYVEEVIKREGPDGILLGFGGQSALNCGVTLAQEGILERYGVHVLGTPIQAIMDTEDRALFKKAMERSNILCPRSREASRTEDALTIADEIGYPVIVRVAYTLGGKGSGVAYDAQELKEISDRALAQSMITQILIEEYIGHWKEVEYEVMRDQANNCLIVCNMENLDPMGVHTGDSIVVAPSQTLSNREYHMLRSKSIDAVRNLGIVGECNIQWALHPQSEEARAIEINARLSRSSALASKATGYPLAYIAAKLSIGYLLPELINRVTGVTTACFEPALDYIVTKIPRWDLQKFRHVDRRVGPQMKSVGEVMAIGRCFEESLQKAIRMLDIGKIGLVCNQDDEAPEPEDSLREAVSKPTDERLFKVVKAMKSGQSIEETYRLSGIDPWFLYKMKNIIETEQRLRSFKTSDESLKDILADAKRLGFSDKQIAVCLNSTEEEIRSERKRFAIAPVVKQIDTLAAEWPAKTNYLYLTYGGGEDDIEFKEVPRKIVVLGAGVFRIGSSVEFDWCAVNTVWALKKLGVEEAIMINYNPETVSTDYDISDKLYFEELTLERVLDIYEKEQPDGVVVSVGGQIPNNIALKLAKNDVRILGTSAESIDTAEDRSKFSSLLDSLQIPQPKWSDLKTVEDAKAFARSIRYPVLIRPSYVLSGSAMRIADSEKELEDFLSLAAKVSPEHPVVISKFMKNAREVEVDGVSDGDEVIIGSIMEHIEPAGVHSGDATMIIPPQTIPYPIIRTMEEYTERIAKALAIRGPFNIQYLVKDSQVYVIECNLRASRSIPFVSKTRGVNLIDLSTRAMVGMKFRDLTVNPLPSILHVGVKVPQFSFMRLSGADPVLGVEMLSTGEVACLGDNYADALLKALESAEFRLPPQHGNVLITIGSEELKKKAVKLASDLRKLGFNIFATEKTARVLEAAGVENVTVLYKIRERDRKPNILDYLLEGRLNLIINIPLTDSASDTGELEDEYLIRRLAVEYNTPVVTTLELATSIVKALKLGAPLEINAKSLNEYMNSLVWKHWPTIA